jgi:oxygen-independent coproporphyrinogen-3 oxidase
MPGIYISWPFCAQKCTYCNFASAVQPGLEAAYTKALLNEIHATRFDWTPDTVYFGGGTPSGITPATLEKILAALPGSPWKEATMEAAPGSLAAGNIQFWRNAGINRVSLGVQSLVDKELARTGRRHNAEIVRRDVAALRAGVIDNINIDLIAGLPGQTEASWKESLDGALRLSPPHVSVYMLEVDEDSRLGSEILAGGNRYGAGDVPADDAIASFYERAVSELAEAGIGRYEISNFALPGFESTHNLKYWRRQPYIGFGADAHSFDGGLRWQNCETAREYVQAFESGRSCRCETTIPNADEERFFVGLRLTEGVAPTPADWRRFGPAFERFLTNGMMERSGERLRLTPRGIMVSNEIFQEFIAA